MPSSEVYFAVSPRTVPIYFFGVFHSKTNKFSAFRFERVIPDVNDFTIIRCRTLAYNDFQVIDFTAKPT